ncbi:uncharacterized protein LOC110737541 [Chenopodium quinoa]|uniref:uncharacterized protein LOC110737541 n=1 Tax=Chenopodium quinoa TaxID=63459 RepID=UPI000B78F43C|nr:uncharacterized protein LOC110737541 [Chenopodium quinoa]
MLFSSVLMLRSSRSGYIPFDPEIERSFHRQKNLFKQEQATPEGNTPLEPPSYSSDIEVSSEPELVMAQPPRKLSDYSQPSLVDFPHLAPTPNLEGVQFEIKPQFITMIERKKFSGAKGEDPNLHILDFCQYSKLWYNGLNRAALCITNWETLALNFYNKYYPAERTALLRSSIQKFSQEADESLYEAWERFKDLQRECPHHGLARWQIMQAFYNGLGYNSRMILDSTANGRFMNLDVNIASNVVEEMAIHNSQLNPRGFANKRKHQVDSISFLQAQLPAISQKLDNINNSNSNSSSVVNVSAIGHWAQECTSLLEKINAFQTYKQTSPYSNTYNAGLKNNQNMSYNGTNVLNPPPQVLQPQQRYYQPPHQRPQQAVTPPSDSGLSEIKTMLVNMQKQMQIRDAQIDSILAHNKIMDNQIAQLSSSLQTRQQRALPSQPDTTPKKVTTQGKSGDVQKLVIKLPFPNRHLKSKLDKWFSKFLEVVKNLQHCTKMLNCDAWDGGGYEFDDEG